MKFFDVQVPFFIPLYRRIIATLVPGLWGVFEVSLGNYFWAILFLGATAFLIYEFFFAWNPKDPEA